MDVLTDDPLATIDFADERARGGRRAAAAAVVGLNSKDRRGKRRSKQHQEIYSVNR